MEKYPTRQDQNRFFDGVKADNGPDIRKMVIDSARDNVMLEEFIDGKEIQVAVVCGKAIGAVEIIPKQSAFYDYKTKYTEGMAKHICPAEIPSKIYKTCLDQSKKVYEFLKCKGVSRADFRYDAKKNRLVMLEFNTHPGFTNLSLVPEIALKCKGITFDQLVEKIILDIKR